MRGHEVLCFARALGVPPERIGVFDLIGRELDETRIAATDVFLLGGSGDYSVAGEAPWLDGVLGSLRRIHAAGTPTFASCWGCQAFARALGGRVVHDPVNAEVGTYDLVTTEAGRADPVFSIVGTSFKAQLGHEDRVVELPPNATLLATTDRAFQAFRFDDAPIYCTQFHPELTKADMTQRIRKYPRYLEHVPGATLDGFLASLAETPRSGALLRRFVENLGRDATRAAESSSSRPAD